MNSFFQLLDSHLPPNRGDGDQVRWKFKKRGFFFVDILSFYNTLRGSNATPFPWKGIWRVKAPQRVSFFCVNGGLG